MSRCQVRRWNKEDFKFLKDLTTYGEGYNPYCFSGECPVIFAQQGYTALRNNLIWPGQTPRRAKLLGVVIIFLCWVFLFLILRNNPVRFNWRESLLAASVIWALILVLFTEVFSFFRILNFWTLFIAWFALLAALAYIFLKTDTKTRDDLPAVIGALPLFLKFVVVSLLLIIFITGLISLSSAPNNFDSMTYHLPRVAHWIQNASVAHYPTNILRQIHMNPGAEYIILHLNLLSGSDWFSNLVQWVSMIGSVAGISLLTKELGGGIRSQIFTSAFAATLPMGILQSTSTKNDYVVAFWIICAVYFGLRFLSNRENRYIYLFAGSTGLSILTKGTAYIFLAPFIISFLFSGLKKYNFELWKPLLMAALIVFSINAGHWGRNYSTFNSPLGPGNEGEHNEYMNANFSARTLFSNVLRNSALQMGSFEQLSDAVTLFVEKAHATLSIDINAPETTWGGTSFIIHNISRNEDLDGNPLHFILFMISLLYLGFKRKFYYAGNLLFAFLLFCLILKWQPWHSRLHLPLFILGAPAVGITLDNWKRGWGNFMIILLLIASLPWVVNNAQRPLAGKISVLKRERSSQYFGRNQTAETNFRTVVKQVEDSGCREIGLLTEINAWEYPLWALLQEKKTHGQYRIEHIGTKTKLHDFTPCIVIKIVDHETIQIQKNRVTVPADPAGDISSS